MAAERDGGGARGARAQKAAAPDGDLRAAGVGADGGVDAGDGGGQWGEADLTEDGGGEEGEEEEGGGRGGGGGEGREGRRRSVSWWESPLSDEDSYDGDLAARSAQAKGHSLMSEGRQMGDGYRWGKRGKGSW